MNIDEYVWLVGEKIPDVDITNAVLTASGISAKTVADEKDTEGKGQFYADTVGSVFFDRRVEADCEGKMIRIMRNFTPLHFDGNTFYLYRISMVGIDQKNLTTEYTRLRESYGRQIMWPYSKK